MPKLVVLCLGFLDMKMQSFSCENMYFVLIFVYIYI